MSISNNRMYEKYDDLKTDGIRKPVATYEMLWEYAQRRIDVRRARLKAGNCKIWEAATIQKQIIRYCEEQRQIMQQLGDAIELCLDKILSSDTPARVRRMNEREWWRLVAQEAAINLRSERN